MITVVVPTIRPNKLKDFKRAWQPLFTKHNVLVIVVVDGKKPYIEFDTLKIELKEVMDKNSDLIYNFNDGVRNLGFAVAAKYSDSDYILSLDDDVEPLGDTIQDHIDALNMRVPLNWMSTASEYTRGFPYGIRNEAPVMLSHGVWEGVPDWDAPTQLTRTSTKPLHFYKGAIPKGVLFPLCAMNFAFRREALPYVYQAPMGPRVGLDRFADIWGGIEMKRDFDRLGWGVVSGYSSVHHKRASNVYNNIIKEAKGLKLNEELSQGDLSNPYWELFRRRRKEWKEMVKKW